MNHAWPERWGEAESQLRGYLEEERLHRHYPSVRFMGLAVVFHGWEMVAFEAVGDDVE